MTISAYQIDFIPLIPSLWLYGLAIFAMIFMVLSFKYLDIRSALLRTIIFTALIITLLNPSISIQERQASADTAIVIVDSSASQSTGRRQQQTKAAIDTLKQQASDHENLHLEFIQSKGTDETHLFETLKTGLKNIPQGQRAGVIMITDGQIHDLPDLSKQLPDFGPLNVLMTGNQNEKDRQVKLLNPPAYGIVGNTAEITYIVQDTDNIGQDNANINLTGAKGSARHFIVPVNIPQTITMQIDHPGDNILEISANAVSGEISEHNNTAYTVINGVRDRLKVLLVSGKPHIGGRSWRDLLKSDPAIDLVHFTILRQPQQIDPTPQNDMALVPFPVHKLFEEKLYDFDLVIFDQYRLRKILPSRYFDNIVKFTKEGGAFFQTSGPEFFGPDSISLTALKDIIPGVQTSRVIEQKFTPSLTPRGSHHPVTHPFIKKQKEWGPFLRQIEVTDKTGDVLMAGHNNAPLLILERIGKGRSAHFTSDHLWLWARGYKSGGPYIPLMRRVIHWLMKEPTLDETALQLHVTGNNIEISTNNLSLENTDITVTKPNGQRSTIKLDKTSNGFLQKTLHAPVNGLYRFHGPNIQTKISIVGMANPKEQRDLIASDEKLKPFSDKTFGNILWLQKTKNLTIKHTQNPKHYTGKNHLPLRKNNAHTILSTKRRSLLLYEALIVFILGVKIADVVV